LQGASDGFVTRFDASGSHLVFSTFAGGTGDDSVAGLALDSSANPILILRICLEIT